MPVTNQDLINSCRVCRNPNQDGDYECLYQETEESDGVMAPHSYAGMLYEELLGELSPETYAHFPRYLCNSCDLQMRLFKKLKDKALKTMEYLSQIPLPKLTTQLDENDDKNFLKQKSMVVHQNSLEDNAIINFKMENNTEKTYEIGPILGNPLQPGHQELNPELNPDLNQTQYKVNESLVSGNLDSSLQDIPLKVVIPETGDIVIPEPEQAANIDKSDYVLEIYEMLDEENPQIDYIANKVDHQEDLQSESVQNYSDYEIVEETDYQMNYDDEQYIEDDLTSCERSGDDLFKATQQRRGTKRKLSMNERKREYQCTECQEVFTSTKEFKYHREHIHTQVYRCKICFKTFKTPYSLPLHMKIHDENPAFQCEICQRTFTQKIHYQYHMNGHNNIRNYKCEECGKAFIGKTDLRIHMRQHNGERPYVCEICGKDYMLSEHLKSHALKHTRQQFPCDICLQNFSTPKTLRQHKQTIHTDKPMFKCQYCMKPFRRKHHLEYHFKHCHGITDILTESLCDVIDDLEKSDGDAEVYVEHDDNLDDPVATEQGQFIQDPGFVAISDDAILM